MFVVCLFTSKRLTTLAVISASFQSFCRCLTLSSFFLFLAQISRRDSLTTSSCLSCVFAIWSSFPGTQVSDFSYCCLLSLAMCPSAHKLRKNMCVSVTRRNAQVQIYFHSYTHMHLNQQHLHRTTVFYTTFFPITGAY